ncbi:uncharacterized protein BX664DRAFT_388871 [Halteromyces radiatus]|uniref:uncharacterized protein n=1 Tax=Halteromyces radiatus TaxID=101107 RepID=UPI00221E408A|nr:uncharacterized protein BX664DRAFT_388871 [Halteromyces radiatus]KAI8079907.1 hypothetical protein BX664DRAFT_388871 [Halteromyces radiatus]
MASNDSHILVDISNSNKTRILTSLDVIIEQGTYCSVGFSRNIVITNNIRKVESAVILLEESILHCGDSFEITEVMSPSSSGKILSIGPFGYNVIIIIGTIASDAINGMLRKNRRYYFVKSDWALSRLL